MDVIEAIRSRRSIAVFLPNAVPAETLERILANGVWAPNHHLTEPWRFAVLGPETQRHLAGRYAEWRMEKIPAEDEARRARVYEESTRKFLSIPTIVAVAALQEGDEKRRREDYAAVCCAIQNIQLAAWAEGVGVKWSTSTVTTDPLTYKLLGFDPERFAIIAFLYIGYPAAIPIRERKTPLDQIIYFTP
jgi:nitroreductase